MALEVTKVVIHRYFDAVPSAPGHKGVCSVFLNNLFAINNVVITRPRRGRAGDEEMELTVMLPCLRSYIQNEGGGRDMLRQNVVTIVDEALRKEIESKVIEVFMKGYMAAIEGMKSGIPPEKNKQPETFGGKEASLVPTFTDIKFYKYIPAMAEGPHCRYDTYVFSCRMDGMELCELRLVIRPQGMYVAVPIQQVYETKSGMLVRNERPNSLATPITGQCRSALENAVAAAFDKFSQSGTVLDDGDHLPQVIRVAAEQRQHSRSNPKSSNK